MTWLIILVLALLIIIFVMIGMYNKLIELKQKADNAFVSVDQNLHNRFELVPNLLNTVKDSMKYEEKIISEIKNAKNEYSSATSVEDKSKAYETLSTNLNSLFTLSQAYPELCSNENFIKLQKNFNATEDDFEYSVKTYNDAAQMYNTALLSFPQTAAAHLFKFEKKSFFD